jgi:methylated-DNA-[protein]-cysteine S-methyltransferase
MTIFNATPVPADDQLTAALTRLAVPAPRRLAERIFARWVEVPGPVGPLFVAFTDVGISYVRPSSGCDGEAHGFVEEFADRFSRPIRPADRPPAGLTAALNSGRAKRLPFDLRGLSAFEQAVLRKALDIPRGETRPYGWIAREIGRPAAVRATGSALGRNPVPILIPCHRVVRSDGDTGNYIFGPAVKEELLSAERVNIEEARRLAGEGIHYLASDTTGIVCFPTCHDARRIGPAHRVGFRTVAKAIEAGYRPCHKCRPAILTSRTA